MEKHKQRLFFVDNLRTFAIILVFLVHLAITYGEFQALRECFKRFIEFIVKRRPFQQSHSPAPQERRG